MLPRALPPSGVRIRLADILAGFQAVQQGEMALRLFRDEICQYFGVRHAFFTSSGRAALSVVLSAFHDINPERDEVALPAYTSFSVPSAVVNAGFKVSLYDLDSETLSPHLPSLEACINDKTLCVVACHLYGYPCAMDKITEIAVAKGVPVIDDAAQAMGAKYKGQYAGTHGSAGIFSLSRGKNITSVDGGIIVTDDDVLAEKLHKISLIQPPLTDSMSIVLKAFILSILLHPRVYWVPQRLPFLHIGASVFNPCFGKQRLTPFQAGIGRKMLGRLEEINRKRKATAAALRGRLEGICHFVTQLDGAEPVYLRLPVFIAGAGKEEYPELGVFRSYPLPLGKIPELRQHLAIPEQQQPVAQTLAKVIMTLPTHEFVNESDIDAIREHVRYGNRTE